MDFYVTFNGHLIESFRPTGWPPIVQEKNVFRAESIDLLKTAVEKRANQLKSFGGLVVTLDDGEKGDPIFGNSKFVPLHMFAFIDVTVKSLASEIPNAGDEGGFVQ
ncbi:MAG: hypothetical protein ACREQ5_07360 [Candidatus Dormibacteria bacterium]